jgi:predicted N-formylglutamate amidohydrolase
MGLLGEGDPHPVEIRGAVGEGLFLIVCDHAGRAVPAGLGRLGLPDEAFDLHIAWDIGAGDLTRILAPRLGAGCILQRYSRLVIDCNREPLRSDAAPVMSDGVAVPGNAALTSKALTARARAIHKPYHAAIAKALDARAARGRPTVLVFMHSFTPRMNDLDRPWQFGVIREEGSRFSKAVLDRLAALTGYLVGDNEPYAMDGVDFSAPLHALARGIDYLELEVRQDLIADADGQARIAEALSAVLPAAARDIGLEP